MTLTQKGLKHSTKRVEKTSQDKVVLRKVRKPDYVELLEDAERWPLSYRIAAEIFRSGVTLDEFESMHIEQNGISRRVYEAFMQFHLGKGYDPARITPVRPMYLRYVPPTAVKEKEKEQAALYPAGRPTRQKALEHIKLLVARMVKLGWKEVDFIQALRDWDEESAPPIKKVKLDFDDEAPVKSDKPAKKLVVNYVVRVGNSWQSAASKNAAEELMQRSVDIENIAPVQNPSTHCYCCKMPLRGTCVSLTEGSEQRNVHIGCYFMDMVHPSQLSAGMKVLSAAEGVYYVWHPVDSKGKGGWLKETKTNEDKKEPTTDGGGGVSAVSGKADQPPTPLPVEAPPRQEVLVVSSTEIPGLPVLQGPHDKAPDLGPRKAKSPAPSKKKVAKRKKLPAGKRHKK